MRHLSILLCLLLTGLVPAMQARPVETSRGAVVAKAKPAKKRHHKQHRRPKPHRKQG